MVKTTFIALALTLATVSSSFLPTSALAAEKDELSIITADRDALRTRLYKAIAHSKERGQKLAETEAQLSSSMDQRKELADRLRRVIAMSKDRGEQLASTTAKRKQAEDRLRRVIAMSKDRGEQLASTTAKRKQAEDRLRRVIAMSKDRGEQLASTTAKRKQAEDRLRRVIAISKDRGEQLASTTAKRKQAEDRLRRAIAHSKSTRSSLEEQLASSSESNSAGWIDQVGASLQASIGGLEGTEIIKNYGDETVKVRLGNNGLFRRAGSTLSTSGKALLSQVAPQLLAQDASFTIVGHTDSIPVGQGGRFDSNESLSLARSMSALQFLREQGVSKEQLSAAGYGADNPIAENDTEEGRQQNRRVEIVLRSN